MEPDWVPGWVCALLSQTRKGLGSCCHSWNRLLRLGTIFTARVSPLRLVSRSPRGTTMCQFWPFRPICCRLGPRVTTRDHFADLNAVLCLRRGEDARALPKNLDTLPIAFQVGRSVPAAPCPQGSPQLVAEGAKRLGKDLGVAISLAMWHGSAEYEPCEGDRRGTFICLAATAQESPMLLMTLSVFHDGPHERDVCQTIECISVVRTVGVPVRNRSGFGSLGRFCSLRFRLGRPVLHPEQHIATQCPVPSAVLS